MAMMTATTEETDKNTGGASGSWEPDPNAKVPTPEGVTLPPGATYVGKPAAVPKGVKLPPGATYVDNTAARLAKQAQPTQFERERTTEAPGFLSSVVDELGNQVKGVLGTITPDFSKKNLYGAGGIVKEAVAPFQNAADAAEAWQRRKAEGRSLPYRMLTGATELAGIPTGAQGEEEALRKGGGTAAVLGHAAVPVAETLGAEALSHIPTKVAGAPIRYGARTAEDVINAKIAKPLTNLGGLNTPADEIVARRLKVPGRDYGLPPKVEPVAKAPAPPPVKPMYTGGEEPLPAAPKALGEIINQSTGARPLEPNVPLREQPKAMRSMGQVGGDVLNQNIEREAVRPLGESPSPQKNTPLGEIKGPPEATAPHRATVTHEGKTFGMEAANGRRMYEATAHDSALAKEVHDLKNTDVTHAFVNAGGDVNTMTVPGGRVQEEPL